MMKPAWSETSYDFSVYRLSASQPVVRVFTVIIGAFNALLLVPDMINLKGSALLVDCALRFAFTAASVVLYFHLRKFRSFKSLSAAIAAVELLAAAVFLLVFNLYPTPDFLIQLLGVMLIILVVFMVPNRLSFMLGVSLISAAGFLAIAFDPYAATDAPQYVAAVTYLLIEIALGVVFALLFLSYQRREYAAKTELQQIYATDPLTQVGNRVRLEKEAEIWLAFCGRHGLPLSLVLIDIDDMKQINDQHGHLIGDATLCELVQTICGHLRRNDVCIRWGGDEFVLLLPGTDAADARLLVERIRAEVENHTFSVQARITCSFGIADTRQGETLEELLLLADRSMYQAKKLGKNTACGADG